MNELRSCFVNCTDVEAGENGLDQHVRVQRKAQFHRFADDWIYIEDRKIPFTTAIVEFEDGRVEKVDPARLKFID